jgi:activator of HSP90 ATPase
MACWALLHTIHLVRPERVTVMRVEWKGVPVGQEEVTKTNWDQYYVRSIKLTFGYGTIL